MKIIIDKRKTPHNNKDISFKNSNVYRNLENNMKFLNLKTNIVLIYKRKR